MLEQSSKVIKVPKVLELNTTNKKKFKAYFYDYEFLKRLMRFFALAMFLSNVLLANEHNSDNISFKEICFQQREFF